MIGRPAASHDGAAHRRVSGSALLVLTALLAGLAALAVAGVRGQAAPHSLEEQAHQIAAGLRCPVCRDLSAADSPAPLAGQMREQIAEQLRAGRSPDEIRQSFVAAYGETVLMSPPRSGPGAAAYVLPLVLTAAGAAAGTVLVLRWRRRPAPEDPTEPSPAELRRVDRALARVLGDGFGGTEPADDRRGRLLRQLRDLDDDLATGKLGVDEHRALRAPVERQAAVALRATARPTAEPDPSRRPRRAGWPAVVALAAGGSVGVAFLLSGAIAPRDAGATITGTAPPGATDRTDADAASPQQLAAVDTAVARVRDHPEDAAAHLDLARAYAAADAAQLAAVEYLAVTRIDPANAEANTALALTAFAAGNAERAQDMVDAVLAAHPGDPEALYARGLIRLMGLRQTGPAREDLTAYLTAAPSGAHRATVEALLAMIADKEPT